MVEMTFDRSLGELNLRVKGSSQGAIADIEEGLKSYSNTIEFLHHALI